MITTSTPSIDVSQFDAAIFDLDGVVTKTARVHAAAWKTLFDTYLKEWATRTSQSFQPFDLISDYRPYVDGKPRNDGVTSFLNSRRIALPYGSELDGPDQETICGLGNRKNALFLEALQDQGVEVYPATTELIRELRAQGKKIAIVTASKNCVEVLQATNLTHFFDVKVDGRDADYFHLQGKPKPDVFLKAAELLGISPNRGIVFEDALAGVCAGHAGHFAMVIGIDRAQQTSALYQEGADVVVSDLMELSLHDEKQIIIRNVGSLPSAFEGIQKITPHIKANRLAIFLDYDGTLTPIVERPELALLSESMRHVLQALANYCIVAIISGRDRHDVKQLVKLDALYYAGSHGFDIAGPQNMNIQYEIGTEFLPSIDQAESELREKLGPISGVLIERKKYSVAVHYRLVAQHDVGIVSKAVSHVLSSQPNLRKTEGKKVYELRPQVDWDKGKALLWLLQTLHISDDPIFPMYLGDDLTDEDAFSVLQPMGMGIIVDATFRFTRAQYQLKNPLEVQQVLETILHAYQSCPS